jgi:hypothetical protein
VKSLLAISTKSKSHPPLSTVEVCILKPISMFLKKFRLFDGVQRPRVRHLYGARADSDGEPRSLSPSRCQTNAMVCVHFLYMLTRINSEHANFVELHILSSCSHEFSLFFVSSCSQGFSTSHTKSLAKPSHIYTRKTMFPPFQNRTDKTRKRNTLLKTQYYYTS